MISKQNIKDIYPLSPMQESMLFNSLIDENSGAYFEQTNFRITGEFNFDLFENAIDKLFKRHDILRTVFIHKNVSRPFQLVLKELTPVIIEKDLSAFSSRFLEEELESIKLADHKKSFQLSSDVLMRIHLIKITEHDYRVIWSHHHILMDGWCIGIIIGEFLELYLAAKENRSPKLEVSTPYSTYIKWLEKYDKQESLAFWKNYLADVQEQSLLSPVNKALHKTYRKIDLDHKLKAGIFKDVSRVSADLGITTSTFVQTIWGFFLCKLNYSDQAVFGTVVSGRPGSIHHVESIIGLFINTIPFKVELNENQTFAELFVRTQEQINQTLGNEYLPLSEIQAQSELASQLINHILIYQNYPKNLEVTKLDPTVYGFKIDQIKVFEQTNYDLNLVVYPENESLTFKCDFNEHVFSPEYVQQLLKQFEILIEKVIANPGLLLREYDLLRDEQREEILFDAYNNRFPLSEQTIIDKMIESIEKYSTKTAILDFENELSYAGLKQQITSIQDYLTKEGIKKGDVVALYAEPGIDLPGIIYAILAQGAVYLPIDPDYPEQRIEYMLSDSKCKLIITNVRETSFDVKTFYHEFKIDPKHTNCGFVNHSKAEDPAYIIYTSGTTGKPKGVLISHKSLCDYVLTLNDLIQSDENDCVIQQGSISFDTTVEELFPMMVCGGSIFIVRHKKDLNLVNQAILSGKATILTGSPLLVNFVNQSLNDYKSLKHILSGGDELKSEYLSSIPQHIKIWNGYGPTESTVCITFKQIDRSNNNITLGTPIRNRHVLILDKFLNIVPRGSSGELCVSGAGLAMCYLNDEEQTQAKFIDNPFRSGEKIYRSGDRARWNENGEIDFLGRIDKQVKIRGYRIEPGEIEQQIMLFPGIANSHVTAVNQEFIRAFVVVDTDIQIDELRFFLNSVLPDYMVPAQFIILDEIPLTLNGKIDRKKLLELDYGPTNEYEEVQTETEAGLSQIWQEILKREQIGRSDHFFHLGGHSLKITILSSLIFKKFQKEIPVKKLFETPVLKDQASLIDSYDSERYERISKAPEVDFYPLSLAQNRLYLLNKINENSSAYNIPMFIQIKGNLDLKRAKNAFERLIERHEILRTSFHFDQDIPVQRIHQMSELDFEPIGFGTPETFSISEFIRPFDLEKAPLFRVMIIEQKPGDFLLAMDVNHIISDGISMGILIDEYTSLYNGTELSPVSVQYKDYSLWQQSFLKSKKFNSQRAFWLDQYRDLPETLELKSSKARPAIQDFKGKSLSFQLPGLLIEKASAWIKEEELSPFIFYFACFKLLLHSYSGQRDFVVGTPVSGRTHPDIQQNLGVFINTLAIRSRFSPQESCLEFVRDFKDHVLDCLNNQDFSFELLVESLNLSPDLSRNALFDVFFALQENELQIKHVLNELEIIPLPIENQSAKFDLTFELFKTSSGINLNIEFNTDLFDQADIELMYSHYLQLISVLLERPESRINKLSILTEEEKNFILSEKTGSFNDSSPATLVSLFLENVAKQPDFEILQFENQSITYRELNHRSGVLANELRKSGVSNEDIVAIKLPRSADYIVCMLGILKSGAAYLPIDPNYPPERQDYVLHHSKAKLIIQNEESNSAINSLIYPELDFTELPEHHDHSKSNELAYVMYTSGSTGLPKGVAIEHRNVVSLIDWAKQEFAGEHYDVVFSGTSFSFDLSVFEIFVHLSTGKRIRLLENGIQIREYAGQEKNILLNTVPSVINDLQNLEMSFENVSSIVMCGEPVPQSVKDRLPYHRLHVRNCYGPTEDTVYSTCYQLKGKNPAQLIGVPKTGTKVYVLNENLDLQAIGIPGELYLSGAGLARGYLFQDDLSAERFLPNPYEIGERMYKTGDLVRWNSNRELEYLGRLDNQVKIRGHRIELGEIETQISQDEHVLALSVTVKTINQDQYICAYLQVTDSFDEESLKERLNKKLPAYMLPSWFVVLDELPMTPNGKIDKNALPLPDTSQRSEKKSIPESENELKLAALWKNILNVPAVYLEDNFFRLGGHSLKATILLSKIHKEFEIKLKLRDIFEYPTLRELNDYLKTQGKQHFIAIEKAEEQEFYPLTSAQKRMYVINQIQDSGSLAYNMPAAFRVSGEIDREKADAAFHLLIQRHESLRTRFSVKGEFLFQSVEADLSVEIEELESYEDPKDLLESFIRPFDLAQAPLFRVGISAVPESKDHLLVFDIHHIISDGTSMGIIIRDFTRIYDGIELEELPLQYKDFAAWQKNYFNSAGFGEQKKYWLNKFNDQLPVLDLETDFIRPNELTASGKSLAYSFKPELSSSIRTFCEKNQTTLFIALTSFYSLLLAKKTGQEDFVIGTPVAGRFHHDLQELVGVFLNMLPLRVKMDMDQSFQEFLKTNHEQFIQDFENQHFPFDSLIEELNIERNLNRNPLYDTMLVVQNMELNELKTKELSFSPLDFDSGISQLDLSLIVFENSDTIEFDVEYNTGLFKEESVIQLMNQFELLIEKIISDDRLPLKKYKLLSDSEQDEMLRSAYSNRFPPKKLTIVDKIMESLQKNRMRIAVQDFENQRSYSELKQQISSLQDYLTQKGIKNGDVVAVYAEIGIDLPGIVYAVLAQGAVYLPIDPIYPQQRVEHMLRDSKCKLLISTKKEHSFEVDTFHYEFEPKPDFADSTFLNYSRVEDPAYIIYTSGTTGVPKGVLVNHQSLCDYVLTFNELIQIQNDDCMIQQSSISFDTSLEELFPVILSGGSIFTVNHRKNLMLIIDAVNTGKPTILNTSPLLVNFINETLRDYRSLRHVISGGDELKNEYLSSIPPHIKIWNGYGPTESTVCISFKKINRNERKITLGKPIRNRHVLILDKYQNIVPAGSKGELCVSGTGLAMCYLNAEEQTRLKFIDHPYQKGEKIYRSGDLSKWDENGELEYLGRIDKQVKIRAYRIELGEIEFALSKIPGVKEVLVDAVSQAGETVLLAYLVLSTEMDEAKIKSELAQSLPDYMIPNQYISLDKMPLSANGKLDRSALPLPELKAVDEEISGAENEVQEILLGIWKSILKKDNIGIDSNFFSLGGDSIKAIQLANRIQDHDLKLEVKDLFTHQSIRQVEAYLKPLTFKAYQGLISGNFPLTPIQKAFFEEELQFQNHYNQSLMLKSSKHISKSEFDWVFRQLISHHDQLRTKFISQDGTIRQLIEEEHISFEITEFNLHEAAEIEAESNRLQASLDLETGKLIAIGLFHNAQETHLLVVMHHLVVDGVSWRIILEDLKNLLTGEKLSAKTQSYASWSEALQDYARSKEALKELPYWENILNGYQPYWNLQENRYEQSEVQHLELNSEETNLVLTEVNHAYNTEINEILVAALVNNLRFLSGSDTNILFLEGHGREEILEQQDIKRTLGWFTSVFPVKLTFEAEIGLKIKKTKDQFRKIPKKGVGYSILRYLNPEIEASGKLNAKSEITFNYLGQFHLDSSESKGDFSVSEFPEGNAIDPRNQNQSAIDITGMVYEDQLKLSVTYNKFRFSDELVSTFISGFKRDLLEITEHCLSKDSVELTVSDFESENLTNEELDDILGMVEDI